MLNGARAMPGRKLSRPLLRSSEKFRGKVGLFQNTVTFEPFNRRFLALSPEHFARFTRCFFHLLRAVWRFRKTILILLRKTFCRLHPLNPY